jgi:hypothetical protein
MSTKYTQGRYKIKLKKHNVSFALYYITIRILYNDPNFTYYVLTKNKMSVCQMILFRRQNSFFVDFLE